MVDPIKSVETPAVAPAVPVVPAVPGQPTPVAEPKSGASSTDVKQVPLQALQEERGKRQEEQSRAESLEAEIAELKRMVTDTQLHQQQQIQQPQQPQDTKQELEKLWEDDPRKAVQVEIMYAMDWRDRVDSSLEIQADMLSRKFPDFNTYRSTALGQVRALPLNQRGGQGVLEAAYFMVRGQNADTLIQQREAELLEKYRRGEISVAGLSNPAGSFSAPAPVAGTVATDEQMRTAAAMGLTTEQYMSEVRA